MKKEHEISSFFPFKWCKQTKKLAWNVVKIAIKWLQTTVNKPRTVNLSNCPWVEIYSDPCQTPKIGHFAIIVVGFRSSFRDVQQYL